MKRCLVVVFCILYMLCAVLPTAAETVQTAPLSEDFVKVASADGMTLYYSEQTAGIALVDATGKVWRTDVTDACDLETMTSSQRAMVTTPLIVEYTLLNSRSNKSERHAVTEMDHEIRAKIEGGSVRITYALKDIAVEIDVVVLLKDGALAVQVPADGIREGIGLTQRLEQSMKTINSNIDYITATIDAMQQDDALKSHRRYIASYRKAFDRYVEQMNGTDSVVDIQYEIEQATSLMQSAQNIFKGGVGETGVFNAIAKDTSLDAAVRSKYAAVYKQMDAKYTQTKLLSQQLGTIKYGALVAISLFPNFGALGDSEDGYVFYPDGSGAITYATEKHPAYQHFYLEDIYSGDKPNVDEFLVKDAQGKTKLLLPVFGVKHGDSAYLGVVSQATEHAAIEYYPSGLNANVHRINAYLRCRRTATLYKNGQSRGSVYELELFGSAYEVRYFFLSGDSADYSGMAARYRQFLLDNGALQKSPLADRRESVALNLIMGVKKRQMLSDRLLPMTTFEQAEEMLQYLHDAGLSDIMLNLQGYSPDGYSRVVGADNRVAGKLGGEKGLKSLTEHARRTNTALFLQSNYASALRGDGKFCDSDYVYDSTGNLISDTLRRLFLVKPVSAERFLTQKQLPRFAQWGVGGITFDRIGSFLYDNHGKDPATRADTAAAWQSMMKDAKGQLGYAAATAAGAFVFDSADWLAETPSAATGYVFTDEAVPFYQMVVHGYLCYTGKAFNKFYDTQYEKMKALEYGYIPVFDLTYEKTEKLRGTDCFDQFSTCFDDWKETVVSVGKEFSALSSVRNQVMRSHERIGEDVVVVTYGDGSRLILNYGKQSTEVFGLQVDAMNYRFIR